ncbi:hypothetical protein AVEN_67459-1 [Araneus ventricosus]|uniref:Mariner Mos1 transposase n=1 Tax=Araneus ventricosus TaxID=182803 RepID=A0A4Y2Q9I6_ARAVE|nr:hypothetical protein AVEN_67459-1 [Araneus ventricosus]
MLFMFWDPKDVILIDFFTFRDHQCGTLLGQPYQTEARHSTQETSSRGVLFLDDNAKPNTVRDTKEHICRLGWERLDSLVCSLNLTPLDFHLFYVSKQYYRDVASEAMKRCGGCEGLPSLAGTDFYQDGFLKLISRYDKCVGGE